MMLISYSIVMMTVQACSTPAVHQLDDKKPTVVSNAVVESDPQAFSSREHAQMRISDDGKYRVSLFSQQFPLPVGVIHNWTVHIERANGEPLLDAKKIYIHGGMPAHRHGFPTTPRVKQHLGNGDYLIEGVKFNMPGEWQMRINIKEQTQRDRVVFDFNVSR